MKRLEVILVLFFLVLFLGHTAFACGSSADANAGASANANAASFASGGSSRVNNVNIADPEIGVQVEVNPGQTVAPETSSKVTIDSHATTKYKHINRQFLPISVPPVGGVMQDFLPPSQFGYPWNFSPVIEGNWKRQDDAKKIKVKELKKYCYFKTEPSSEVIVVTDHKVLVSGKIIGEVKIKGAEKEDSRELQMAAVDLLAGWGANVVWFRINGLEHEARSSYSGFILGGGAGAVMASQEKVATSGSGGIGKGSTRLGFLHYPIVHAIGYRGKILKKVEKKKVKKEELKVEGDGKKWQAIQ